MDDLLQTLGKATGTLTFNCVALVLILAAIWLICRFVAARKPPEPPGKGK
jgi:hypothetical protein